MTQLTMKAAVLRKPYELNVEEVPVPVLEDNEVLIKVKSCGICGSDVHAYHGTHPRTTYPRIPGHEFSGIVDQIGNNVKNIRKGMRVTSTLDIQCSRCWACCHGHLNNCVEKKTIGFTEDGGLGQYLKAPEGNVLQIPDSIDFEEAALAETLAVGYGGVVFQARVGAGEVVAIVGAGPVGLSVLMIAKACGAFVIISDIHENRLKIANSLGANLVVNANEEDLTQVVYNITNGKGADKSFETVGGEHTTYQTVDITRPRGSIVIMGSNSENKAYIPVTSFKERELNMFGSRGIPFDSLEKALTILGEGSIKLKKLLTHRFALEEIHKAFKVAELEKDSALKILINHDN